MLQRRLDEATDQVKEGLVAAQTWWEELTVASSILSFFLASSGVGNLYQWFKSRASKAREQAAVEGRRLAEEEARTERRDRLNLQRDVEQSVLLLQRQRCRPKQDREQGGGGGGGEGGAGAVAALGRSSTRREFILNSKGARKRLSSTRSEMELSTIVRS
jgi:hypothetical protein